MVPYGHARFSQTGQPVLINWVGKRGSFPRYGVFEMRDLEGHVLREEVSEYNLDFGGCTDAQHPSSECPFLHEKEGE